MCRASERNFVRGCEDWWFRVKLKKKLFTEIDLKLLIEMFYGEQSMWTFEHIAQDPSGPGAMYPKQDKFI